jgi:hypothetical protein
VKALQAYVNAFSVPGHESQTVEITMDGQRVARWELNGPEPSWQVIPLPEGTVGTDGEIDVELTIAAPRSPASLGLSTDSRRLGIGLIELKAQGKASS